MGIEVCVKAAPGEPNARGDHPVSQIVLLTLEEKKLPYKIHLIEDIRKPDWFLAISPEGKLPLVKFDDDENWVAGCDVILGIIEEKYPEPSLATFPPEFASVGSKLIRAYIMYMTMTMKKDHPDNSFRLAFSDELEALENHFKTHGGPFLAGEKLTTLDLKLAPNLYNLTIVLGHYKNWCVPENLTNVRDYMKVMFSLESFKKTKASKRYMIPKWAPKLDRDFSSVM